MAATFSIKDYSKHSEEVKRVALKYYEWALDHQINRYHPPHPVFASSSQINTTTTKPSNSDATSSTPSTPPSSAKPSSSKTQPTTPNFKYLASLTQGIHYPKYVAVMVQYISKINTEKLNKEIKNYQNAKAPERAGKQFFHYRLVEDKESTELTGYEHNGVVPVLMKTKYPLTPS
jgi:hypothetical protein